MTKEITDISAIEATLVQGDLSRLSSDQRLSYYKNLCESVGLNPLSRPFEYLTFQGKLVLYARKDATEQLRKIYGVSITRLDREIIEGVCVVTAYARDKHGKEDSDIGAVDVKGLSGERLANAIMKATTKAKRRVTLSVSGLGILDETEVDGAIAGEEKAARINQEIQSKPAADASGLVQIPHPSGGSVAVPAQMAPSSPAPTPFDDDPGPMEAHAEVMGDSSLASYVVPDVSKKYKGRTFADVGIAELRDYGKFMREYYEKEKREPRGKWAELLNNIDSYLG